jgi:hypothetical protein
MQPYTLVRIALALACASAALAFGTQSRADPLITQGIGISNCAKLATDLKPSVGLDHQANYLLTAAWLRARLSKNSKI